MMCGDEMYEYSTIAARYGTVWPALISILFGRWIKACFVRTAVSGKTWLRQLSGGLFGLIPALLLGTLLISLLCLVPLWPFGFLIMLPVRVALNRGSGDLGSVWMLCFFSAFTFWILWIVAIVLAMRDPKRRPVSQS